MSALVEARGPFEVCIRPPGKPSINAKEWALEQQERGCSRCLETLEIGQVWELAVGSKLEPSLLLQLYVGKLGTDAHDYWRCLSLESGIVFSAAVRRWDPHHFGNQAREDNGDVPLCGRRLA
jgi:hypothetical protein